MKQSLFMILENEELAPDVHQLILEGDTSAPSPSAIGPSLPSLWYIAPWARAPQSWQAMSPAK